MAPTPAFELRIDDLVLHGYDPGDRRAFAEALQHELGALFAGEPPAGWSASGARRSLDAGTVELAHDAPARVVAAQVAGAIHRGLSRSDPGATPRGPSSPGPAATPRGPSSPGPGTTQHGPSRSDAAPRGAS